MSVERPSTVRFSYLSLSISHFNLEYLDLCKLKLFDKQLQSGLVIQLVVQFYNCIAVYGKYDEDDVHYSIYKQTRLKFDVEFMVPQFILCFQAYLSDVQLIIQCNYSYSFIFIWFKVIQFIQLRSLCSYSFKQIMSVERPSTARLFDFYSDFFIRTV